MTSTKYNKTIKRIKNKKKKRSQVKKYSHKSMKGGAKANSFFSTLGYGWSGNVSSWPGASSRSTNSCNGITQSNHLSPSRLGITSGIPVATNALPTVPNQLPMTMRGGKKSRKYKKKRRTSTSKKVLKGGGRNSLIPNDILMAWRSFTSAPKYLSNMWNGKNNSASIDPRPYSQPIGNTKQLHLNSGYKLTPDDISNMADSSVFSN